MGELKSAEKVQAALEVQGLKKKNEHAQAVLDCMPSDSEEGEDEDDEKGEDADQNADQKKYSEHSDSMHVLEVEFHRHKDVFNTGRNTLYTPIGRWKRVIL